MDFARSPLVEVIAHLRFAHASTIQTSRSFFGNLGPLLENLSSPVRVLTHSSQVQAVEGGNHTLTMTSAYKGLQFEREGGAVRTIFGPDSCWISLVGSYKGGERFTSEFAKLLEFLSTACPDRPINMIAVRYIDRIEHAPLGLTGLPATKCSVITPDCIVGAPSNFDWNLTFPVSIGEVSGRLLIGQALKGAVSVFDSELRRDLPPQEAADGASRERLMEEFIQLKELSVDLFRQTISNELSERLMEEGIAHESEL